jgi:dihydroflavonol-4-reductase
VATLQEAYARLSGKPVLLSMATVRLMVKEANRSHFNHTKSERELGLTFRPVEQTLKDTVAWLRNNER